MTGPKIGGAQVSFKLVPLPCRVRSCNFLRIWLIDVLMYILVKPMFLKFMLLSRC